jgi:hypothetical protein
LPFATPFANPELALLTFHSETTNPESTSAQAMTGFFDLPPELRNIIYHMVLIDDTPKTVHLSDSQSQLRESKNQRSP